MSKIRKIHDMLVNREITCVELTKRYLEKIKEANSELNAYITVTEQQALESAKKVDERIASSEDIPLLCGVPMTLKDNISTKGIKTTCASKMLCDYTPVYDATVWEILKNEGAVLLGKTNMDEFAMGSSCENSYFGATKNPHNTEHCAGGSSGGVASAVCADIAVYGLGSDTGGSIRQPASFCSLVGLKPTYGAVSRYGLIAYASSFDAIGPVAHSVEDAAIVFDAIAKYDDKDSTSTSCDSNTCDHLFDDIKGKKIGVANEYLTGLSDDVKKAFLDTIKKYEELGAQIVYFDMPALKFALPVYYILACAEASSNLGRYDGIRYGYKTPSYTSVHDMVCKTRSEGFSMEVKRRILLGTYVLSSGYYDAYYRKAQNVRGAIVKAFDDAFDMVDVMLAPTVPVTAFKLGQSAVDAVKTYNTDICTVPVNIAGLPAVSIPCGKDRDGMPIGVQIIGRKFDEKTILNFANVFEKNCEEKVQTKWGVKL